MLIERSRQYTPPGFPICLVFGPNDGGISRGDREETGDEEARPAEKGSGPAQPTVDDSALGGSSSIQRPPFAGEEQENADGMEVMLPNDGRLGLTNYADKPPQDWAAGTGEATNPE